MNVLHTLKSTIIRVKKTGFYKIASSRLRISRKIAIPILCLAAAEGLTVLIWTDSRTKSGNGRIYDPPTWEGYSKDDISKVMRNREPILSAVRALYELKEGVTEDKSMSEFFSEDCILEDPYTRCDGREKILRAFALLPKALLKSTFDEFQPVHHEKMIQIKTVKTCESQPNLFGYNTSVTRRSNLIIHLEKDQVGTEKAKYVVDEWNYMPLIQPETHNKYVFVGSVAKYLRRLITWYYFLSLDGSKSWLNIFWIRDVRDFCVNKGVDMYNEAKKSRNTKLDRQENVFNAGQNEE